jgi:hypothetical protein
MKKYFHITCLFLTLIFPERIFLQDSYGYLIIESELKRIKILIDDTVYIYSDKLRLTTGSHTIVAQNPDRVSFQAMDFVTKLDIRPGEEHKIAIVFEKLAEINSFPGGAEVSFNSEALGKTPMYLPLSRYRDGVLHFKKTGFHETSVMVTDSSLVKNFVFMELNPKSGDAGSNQNQFANKEWQERGLYKYKNEIIITQSLGIIFGAGAAYYKKKADDAFEKAKMYRRLGNLTAKDHQLEKTKKYDKYAAIGLIGMQVNVAALIYYLFRSK